MKKKISYEQVYTNETSSFRYKYYKVSITEEMPFHQHPEWELSLILKGEGQQLVGSSLEPFNVGKLTFLPPNLPHCWIFDKTMNGSQDRTESITIQFKTELITEHIAAFPEFRPICQQLLSHKQGINLIKGTAESIRKIMLEMNSQDETNRFISFIRIIGKIAQSDEYTVINMLREQNKEMSKGISRIEKVYRYIFTHYMDKITLKEIASVASMSETAFCAFFKQTARQSFSSFLCQYRIEVAAKHLLNTSMSIANICFSVGFNDIPHFNRMFKKIKGCSPKEYIKRTSKIF